MIRYRLLTVGLVLALASGCDDSNGTDDAGPR